MPRRALILLLPAIALPLALILLSQFAIPLGQGSFIYRYSPLAAIRTLSALYALPGIAMLFLAVRLAGPSRLGSRSTLLASAAFLYLAAFTYFALPGALRQHYVNLLSPSHEGAFIYETRTAPTATQYVAKFPSRQALSIDELKGTRILSNPPGTTLLAYAIRDSWPPGFIEDYLREEINLPGESITLPALAYKLSAVLTALWILSAIPLYHAARLFDLPPPSALAAAAIVIFSPSAIHFSPGKDPAQLFLAAIQLLGAALAARATLPRHQAIGAALLATATTLGALFSLLLLWTGLTTLLFLAPPVLASPRRLPLLSAAALLASLTVYLTLRLSLGLDLISTTLSVARHFAAVQPQIKLDLPTWRLIGLPIFLLFLPPALFSLPFLRNRPFPPRRSWHLLAATLLTMSLTYLLGVPYELPRLWVVFLPFLTLGLFLATPLAHSPRARHLLTILTLLSLLAALVHWTQLDPRESEYRLTSGRHFN